MNSPKHIFIEKFPVVFALTLDPLINFLNITYVRMKSYMQLIKKPELGHALECIKRNFMKYY